MTDTPTAPVRRDGWTPERREGFIEALSKTGSVKAAAQAVGMTTSTAYRLRARHEAFAAAWDAVMGQRIQSFHDLAMERLTHGVAEPLVYRGRVIGYRVDQDLRLLMSMLRISKSPSARRIAAEFRVEGHETEK